MLYDLRANLSEVSTAAKKRQADAAAREASLEESLQLAQQRLAEEKHGEGEGKKKKEEKKEGDYR